MADWALERAVILAECVGLLPGWGPKIETCIRGQFRVEIPAAKAGRMDPPTTIPHTMTRILIAALAAASLAFSAPSEVRAQNTITDIVASSGGLGQFDRDAKDFDILLNAVLTVGLEGALADPNFGGTVFAPNDAAFLRLARDLGFTGGRDEQGAFNHIARVLNTVSGGNLSQILTDVLLYHTTGDRISVFGLIFRTILGRTIDTGLAGATIRPFFFYLIDNDPDFATARVAGFTPIDASNGRIWVITRVLIPADI